MRFPALEAVGRMRTVAEGLRVSDKHPLLHDSHLGFFGCVSEREDAVGKCVCEMPPGFRIDALRLCPPPQRPVLLHEIVVYLPQSFGAPRAAKRPLDASANLFGSPVDVTVIDPRNCHLFQPLLCQVATAALSPADVAWPIRGIFAKTPNVRVVLGKGGGVDLEKRSCARIASTSLTIISSSRPGPATPVSAMTNGR